MAERIEIDLSCEDRAHEEFLIPVIRRLAHEVGVSVRLRTLAARGGHPRALQAFRKAQRVALKGGAPLADLLIVAIDANCSSLTKQKREILRTTERDLGDRLVMASPDPHIERWYMADPASFKQVVGKGPEGHYHQVRALLLQAAARGHDSAGRAPDAGGRAGLRLDDRGWDGPLPSGEERPVLEGVSGRSAGRPSRPRRGLRRRVLNPEPQPELRVGVAGRVG